MLCRVPIIISQGNTSVERLYGSIKFGSGKKNVFQIQLVKKIVSHVDLLLPKPGSSDKKRNENSLQIDIKNVLKSA